MYIARHASHRHFYLSQNPWFTGVRCLWQVLNAYCKVYPTPPPSRRPIRVKQARLAAEKAAEKAARGSGQQQKGGDEEADKGGRHKLGVSRPVHLYQSLHHL